MSLARIAGWLGVTQSAAPFCPMEHAGWNEDPTALRHELAHALVWLHHGGAVNQLRLARAPDGFLEPSVRYGALPQGLHHPDVFAHRYIAGELGARIYLRLPVDRLSLRRLQHTRVPMGIRPLELADRFAEPVEHNRRSDMRKLLELADEQAPRDWKRWIRKRLMSSAHLVTRYYPSIEAAAAALAPTIRTLRPGHVVSLSSEMLAKVLQTSPASE